MLTRLLVVPFLWTLSLPAFAQERAVVRCCNDPAVEEVVDGYLKAQEGLAGKGRVSSTIYVLRGKVSSARRGAETDEAREVLDQLYDVVDAVKNKREAGIRKAFPGISRWVTWLVLHHEDPKGDLQLSEGVCDEKKTWWQTGDALNAPYKGSCSWQ